MCVRVYVFVCVCVCVFVSVCVIFSHVHLDTGVSFFVLADPTHSNIDALMKKLYELYADYVLKNPFYALDMPIQ